MEERQNKDDPALRGYWTVSEEITPDGIKLIRTVYVTEDGDVFGLNGENIDEAIEKRNKQEEGILDELQEDQDEGLLTIGIIQQFGG